MAKKEKTILQLDGEINLKADKAKADMQELKELLDKFKKTTIEVKAQTRSARMSIQNLGDFLIRTFAKEQTLKLNTSEAKSRLETIKSLFDVIKGNKTITLTLDAKNVKVQLDEIRKDITKIEGKHVISFNVTSKQAKDQVQSLARDINRIKNVDFNIGIKNNLALKDLNTFTKNIAKLASLQKDIEFGIKVKSVQNSLDRVNQISNKLANLKNNNAINFTDNNTLHPILGKLKNLVNYLKEIKQNSKIKIEGVEGKDLKKLNIQADYTGLNEVERKLAIIRAMINQINRRRININGTVTVGSRRNRNGGTVDSSSPVDTSRVGNRAGILGGSLVDDLTSVIHFWGRSSKGFGSFGEAVADMLSKLNMASGGFGALGVAITGATAVFATLAMGVSVVVKGIELFGNALGEIANLVTTALKPGFELMAQRDTTALTTKAALKTSAEIDGRKVTSEEAAAESTYMFNRALQTAAKTVLNLDDILKAQQGVLPMLLNKGMTPKQAQDVVFGVAGVAKTGRLAPNQVLQETRDLAQGSITARSSQVANILGITNQDLAKFKGDADALYDYLMDKFKEYSAVMKEYAETPVGAIEQLQETWGIAAMTIVDEYGPLIVEMAHTITDSLGQFNEETGNFELSPWLNELAEGLKEIVVYAASCADSIYELIQEIVGGNDPIEVMINFIKDMVGMFTFLIETLLRVVEVFKGVWVVMRVGISIIESATKAAWGFAQALRAIWVATSTGDMNSAFALFKESRDWLNESGQALLNATDLEGNWNDTIQTGWLGKNKKSGYDTFLGSGGGKFTEIVTNALDKAANREIPKGKDYDKMRGKARDEEDEKARKKLVQESQKHLKERLAKLKEILSDTLDRLKDLLEKNEVAYKEGFKSVTDYLKAKTELERQEAEARLQEAQEELKAIQESEFNSPYDKLKETHKVQREIDKYTKQLSKATVTQSELNKDIGNFVNAFENATDKLAVILGGKFNSNNSTNKVQMQQSGTWKDFGDSLVNIASYVSSITGYDPKLLWAQMMHETGGDYKNQSKYDDHNYGGISVFDGATNKNGRTRHARPSNEGGWYEWYESDKEYADHWIEVLSQAKNLRNAKDPTSFAKALKEMGYFTAPIEEYVNGLSSWYKKAPEFTKGVQTAISGSVGEQVGSMVVTSITDALEYALSGSGGDLLYKQMPDLTEGCVEAVVQLGSYYNDLLLNEAKKGTNNVDVLMENLKASGVQYEEYEQGKTVLQPGDVLVNNNGNHVMLVLDKDHVVGNSSGLQNPRYGGESGIVKAPLEGWHSNTAIGVLRTGTAGVNLGGSNILLQDAHPTKEAMENFNLLQEFLNKYNDVLSSINDDIFGNLPMLDVKLRSLYEQLQKASRSGNPQDMAMAEALRTRIAQETNKAITDALTNQLDFNLNRLNTTAQYRATDLAFGKNKYQDTSVYSMARKYYEYIYNPIDTKSIKERISAVKKELEKYAGIDDTNTEVERLRGELSDLEQQLTLAKQRPANQIELLKRQFMEATNRGNTTLAESIKNKIFESENKLLEMYESWIDAVNKRFDLMGEYFDAIPMTNLQRERGEEELKAYRNQQLSKHYRASLASSQQALSSIRGRRVQVEYNINNRIGDVRKLRAEYSLLIEDEERWRQKIIETNQRIRISDELGKLPNILEKTKNVAKQALEDGLVTFLTDGVNEAESLGEALRNLATDFLKTMQEFFAKQMVTDLMNMLFPPKTEEGEELTDENLYPGSQGAVVSAVSTGSQGIINAIESLKFALTGSRSFDGYSFDNNYSVGDSIVGSKRLNQPYQDSFTLDSFKGSKFGSNNYSFDYASLGLQKLGETANMAGQTALPNFTSGLADSVNNITNTATNSVTSVMDGQVNTSLSMLATAAQNAANSLSMMGMGAGISSGSMHGSTTSTTSMHHATGGYISGPGTSTSDSIPAMLSSGEYVIKASSVKKYGSNFLDSVNSGTFSRIKAKPKGYADGGLIGDVVEKGTTRGISDFGKSISNNITNNNNATINVALVRDEQEGMRQLLKSPEGQRIMLDFSRKYARVTSKF